MTAWNSKVKLERAAYKEGVGKIPVQLFADFKENVTSTGLGRVTPCIKGQYISYIGKLVLSLNARCYPA